MPSSDSRRNHRAGLPRAAKKVQRGNRASHSALRDHRERCIEALRRLEVEGGTNSFFDKAMTLLTRHWVGTPWSGRADLLQTVDWLMRVGAHSANSGESMSIAAAASVDLAVSMAPRRARRRISR
jgi:hypothetical protein